jgi:hypothetical protein
MAVPTAMRVRNDRFFGAAISAGRLPPGFKPGEYIADPQADLQWPIVEVAHIKAICLLDYRGPEHNAIRDIDADELYNYMEHFSLAVNIYGLREDLFDYLGADAGRLSSEWNRTKSKLRGLVDHARLHYVSCDMTDDRNLSALCERLTEN